jgi:hypothetical protein
MINKMDEQIYWKDVHNGKRRQNYSRPRNELKRGTDKAKEEYLESISDYIMEFQRTGRYDLICTKTTETGLERK